MEFRRAENLRTSLKLVQHISETLTLDTRDSVVSVKIAEII